MKAKLPWLPSEAHPGQATRTCPRCRAPKLIPWTLRRDPRRVVPVRTWVCAACQFTVERDETEAS